MFFIKIWIQLKAIAKRKPVIESVPFEISNSIETSNELITDIVKRNVKNFNEKEVDQVLFQYLTEEEIQNQSAAGKIGFNDRKDDRKQEEQSAIENALQCFEDGIFRLFINGQEVQLDQKIKIAENDELVFIRLTMLAGRLW